MHRFFIGNFTALILPSVHILLIFSSVLLLISPPQSDSPSKAVLPLPHGQNHISKGLPPYALFRRNVTVLKATRIGAYRRIQIIGNIIIQFNAHFFKQSIQNFTCRSRFTVNIICICKISVCQGGGQYLLNYFISSKRDFLSAMSQITTQSMHAQGRDYVSYPLIQNIIITYKCQSRLNSAVYIYGRLFTQLSHNLCKCKA